MSGENGLKGIGEVIQIDEARIRDPLGETVRGTVEEALNAMLDAEADQFCGASQCQRSESPQDTGAGCGDCRLVEHGNRRFTRGHGLCPFSRRRFSSSK